MSSQISPQIIPSDSTPCSLVECRCKECQCDCHRAATEDELPPPEERWYSVVVGRNPNVVQGQDQAECSWRGVSGSMAFYFPDQSSAQKHFSAALQCGEVVKVTPETQTPLCTEDLYTLPGFRASNPTDPEIATWVIVSVGQEPGVYLVDASYLAYGLTVNSNVNGVSGAQVTKFKSRAAAVEEFERLLKCSLIVRVADEVRTVLDA